MRPPQSGLVQVGLGHITIDLLEARWWTTSRLRQRH